MSDLPPEGSLANPYRENPPTHFVEVHWSGGATTWPTAPFSYLERSGATSVLDSYTGTASFWLRVNGTLEATDQEMIVIAFVIGPRHAELGYDVGLHLAMQRSTSPDCLRFVAYARRYIGSLLVTNQPIDTASATGGEAAFSLAGDVLDNKWAHFLATWNFEAITGTLTVNKIPRELWPYSELTPTAVPWTQPARFFGADYYYPVNTIPIQPAKPMTTNHKISLAHVWIHATDTITDISKFVTADNTPAAMGPAGEITIGTGTIAPHYYFKGGPSSFVKNAGSGGLMALVGEPPVAQSIAPKIGM